jgi:DNA-binding NarL/FixJ family response regulator
MRVVIGEDQTLMRAGLSLVLGQAGFEIVAIAGDAEDTVRKTAAHRPDLLITDIRMPPTNTDDGLRAAIEARTRFPGLPVLVLSQYLQRDYAVELLESGDEGVGYLLKQRIADVDRSSPTCAGSPPAAPCSTLKSSPRWSSGTEPTRTRWRD